MIVINTLQYGQIVKSKAGRDLGKVFVIIELEGEYVYLVDGHLRRIETPKRKKVKHIQPINRIIEAIRSKIQNGEKLTNNDIRKHIAVYQNEQDSL